jgi:GT2 family glycosyltransferase
VEPEQQPPAPQPVVAVVVTHDAPGNRLDQVLRALAVQDYPNLDMLVVDTGTIDPTDRVRAALPAARVRRVDGNPGFGAAANVVLDMVSGAEFYVFCHDDALPNPGAVTALVTAASRWDADVVGPKLVEWDDDHRFSQFGLTVDKVGVSLPFVERGELDQGQHDGLRDVFAVPGAFTLVRAERFAEIGGFDEAITFLGDALSLSWRARVAGARVLVTSAARVRHAEAFAARPDGVHASRLAARHRVRVLLTSYRATSLLRVVPQALVLAMVEAIGAIVTGRPGRARAALGAWPWNLRRLPSLLAARREVARFRSVSDREVRRHQVRGVVGPRLTLMRVGGDGRTGGGRHGLASRRVAAVPVRGHMTVDPAAWSPATVLVAACLAAVVVFGSRHLVTRTVPVVGEMVPVGGGTRGLLGAWAGGWRPVGLGADAATPALAGAFGLLGTVLAGQVELVRTLLVVGMLPLGVVGAHYVAAPTGSKRSQIAAAVAYAAVPLPYDALSAGRWSSLAAYAAAPWMLGRLARASGVMPFGPVVDPVDDEILPGGAADDLVVRHKLWKHVVVTGAVTALAGLIVPQAPALLVLMGVGLVAGSLFAGEARGIGRLAVATAGGAAVAALLLLPTTIDVVSSPGGVDAWLGADRVPEGLSALDLLALRTGPMALAGVAFALLAAAAAPLLIGRRWRLGWAVRGWTVAVAAWALVWAREQGWVTVRLPDAGVLLAPAAAGLALAVALGVSAIDHDVRGRSWRFGFRRLVVAVGALALVASTASVVVASLDGWWGMPRDDFAGLLGFVDDDVRDVPSRVLWVGATELLPGGDGWDLDDQLSFTASTTSAVPGVAELWPATSGGASSRLGDALELALARDTNRLGRVLAPMGVQYVAVPGRLAPSDETPRDTARDRVADELVSVLAEQLDLEQVRIDRGIVLYRNTAFTPLRSVAPDTGALDETSVAGMATVDLSGADAVLVDGAGARAVRGIVPAGGTVVQASTASDNWRLTVDGRVVDHRTAYGWADAYTVDLGGAAGLTYRTPLAVRALAAAQAVLWSLVLGVALRMWFGPGEPPPAPSRGGRDEEPAAEVAAASDAADVPAPGDDALSPARPPQAPGPSPAEPTSPDRVPVGPVARR